MNIISQYISRLDLTELEVGTEEFEVVKKFAEQFGYKDIQTIRSQAIQCLAVFLRQFLCYRQYFRLQGFAFPYIIQDIMQMQTKNNKNK